MTELLLEIYGEEIPPSFQYEGKEKIKEAFSNNDYNAHFEWIEKLIVSYYDNMYDYQLNKKIDRCIFKGNKLECLEYLRS